jgi:hypothetical protein
LPESIEEEELAEEAQPDAVPQSDDPPTYGKNNRDLPQQLKDALATLVKKFQGRDVYDRRIEVLMDRILRFYYDGVQHVYPNWGTGVYQVGTAGGYVNIGNGQSIQCPEFMGAYNIFRIRARALDAVLTQNEPDVDFAADRPGHSEDIEAEETAEGYRHIFDQNNDVKALQQRISYMFRFSGRAVAWTKTTKSRRFGRNADGEPKSMETCEIYGTLESKVPIVCDAFSPNGLYCFLYDDLDVLRAKAENDWIRSEITAGEAGLGESDWERYARIGARQAKKSYYLTGMALSYLTTEMNCFLRAASFEDGCMDDPFIEEMPDQSDSAGKTLRDVCNMLWPDGVHIRYIGKNYSESWNEDPDDALDVGFPLERDGLSGGALMEPDKVVQDVFNDYMNAKRENYEKGWSFTYFRGDAEDYDAITDQRSKPGNVVLLKQADPGHAIEESFYREPQAEAPAGFDEAITELRMLSQELVGALPAIEGNAKPEQTASGQAMDRSQAMGMLGPAWANMQVMFGGIYTKAALLASKNPDHGSEIVVTSGDGKNTTVKLERLKKGKFHAHISESSFPETTASKRANFQTIIQMAAQSPMGQTLFESPDNWEEFLALNGNPDLVLTPAMAFKKQTRELELLLREPPVDNPAFMEYNMQHAALALEARGQGLPEPPYQPPPPQLPSLMPEADDYHQWESAKCQEYLSTEDCWIRQNIGQPDEIEMAKQGVQNVRLHKGIHDQFMAQQAMVKAQAAQVMKLPSESINFKDEGPTERAQMNAQAGIKAAAPEAQPGVAKNAAAPGTPGTGTV